MTPVTRRSALVDVDPRARAAWPWTPAKAPPGAVIVGDGVVLRVREDGGLEPVLPPGYPRPGPASDPTNTRRR